MKAVIPGGKESNTPQLGIIKIKSRTGHRNIKKPHTYLSCEVFLCSRLGQKKLTATTE